MAKVLRITQGMTNISDDFVLEENALMAQTHFEPVELKWRVT